MHERFHTGPARKHRDAPSGFDVDRLKCALFAFEVEADRIHDCPGTADSTRHCCTIIYVGRERLDAGNIAGKQRTVSVGMPRGDANREISILQMADNAAAEKSGAAKYGHASARHVTKVSCRPELSDHILSFS
jgi:hypothetical protein